MDALRGLGPIRENLQPMSGRPILVTADWPPMRTDGRANNPVSGTFLKVDLSYGHEHAANDLPCLGRFPCRLRRKARPAHRRSLRGSGHPGQPAFGHTGSAIHPCRHSTPGRHPAANPEAPPGFGLMVDRPKATLADQLSVKGETIQLALAQAVIWPDASLGAHARAPTHPGADARLCDLPAGGRRDLPVPHRPNLQLRPFSGRRGPFPEIPVTPSGIQDGVPWLPVN